MTTKDHPRRIYAAVARAWYGDEYAEGRALGRGTPAHPVADREGQTNPDDETTRWEWDDDLSPEQEAAFDTIVAVHTAGGGADLDISMLADEIDVLKMYRDTAQGTPTVAQHERAIRALIEVVRYLVVAER